jgi:excisionase family DNA binding protein
VSARVNLYPFGRENSTYGHFALEADRSRELLASGEIPSIKVGGSTRVSAAALQQWIDRQAERRAAEGHR